MTLLVQLHVGKLPSPLEKPIHRSLVPCATWIQSALPSPFRSAKKCAKLLPAPIFGLDQDQSAKPPLPLASPTQPLFEPCATCIQSGFPSPFTSAKKC